MIACSFHSLLSFILLSMILTWAWGQRLVESKTCFSFSHTYQLIRMKFDVALKQFKLKILKHCKTFGHLMQTYTRWLQRSHVNMLNMDCLSICFSCFGSDMIGTTRLFQSSTSLFTFAFSLDQVGVIEPKLVHW